METLTIVSTNLTPNVILNGNTGAFSFNGKSYPENVNEFYGEILSYLELYIQSPQEKTIIDFNWIYFNTATYKIIVKIIVLLKAVKTHNKEITINWYCKTNDDLMQEKGEELQEVLETDFSIILI